MAKRANQNAVFFVSIVDQNGGSSTGTGKVVKSAKISSPDGQLLLSEFGDIEYSIVPSSFKFKE